MVNAFLEMQMFGIEYPYFKAFVQCVETIQTVNGVSEQLLYVYMYVCTRLYFHGLAVGSLSDNS